MKKQCVSLAVSILILFGLTFSALSVAHGGEKKESKEEKPTAEESAFEFRDSVFHALAWKFGQLVGAKMTGDKPTFQGHATDMASLAGMISEGFIPNSMVDGSLAKQEIWENFDDFSQRAIDAQTALTVLAQDNYDMKEFNPKKFGGKQCGSCHRKYKERD